MSNGMLSGKNAMAGWTSRKQACSVITVTFKCDSEAMHSSSTATKGGICFDSSKRTRLVWKSTNDSLSSFGSNTLSSFFGPWFAISIQSATISPIDLDSGLFEGVSINDREWAKINVDSAFSLQVISELVRRATTRFESNAGRRGVTCFPWVPRRVSSIQMREVLQISWEEWEVNSLRL